jgi:hypothetical protein
LKAFDRVRLIDDRPSATIIYSSPSGIRLGQQPPALPGGFRTTNSKGVVLLLNELETPGGAGGC